MGCGVVGRAFGILIMSLFTNIPIELALSVGLDEVDVSDHTPLPKEVLKYIHVEKIFHFS